MQAALSGDRQTRDPELGREFRIVASDLRGDGMSDRPVGDAHHRTGKFWRDEVRAVIGQTGLRRPTLIGWSHGGRVMGDHLLEHGHAGLVAMNWVGAVSSAADPSRFGRGGRFGARLTSADPATAIRGTVSFLRECFEVLPTTADVEPMLAFNMMVPRHARISLTGRQATCEPRSRELSLPTVGTQGQPDKLITAAMGRHTASLVRGADR